MWWADSWSIRTFDCIKQVKGIYASQERQKTEHFWVEQWYSMASSGDVTSCVICCSKNICEQQCIWWCINIWMQCQVDPKLIIRGGSSTGRNRDELCVSWRSLLWSRLILHSCKKSVSVFTESFLVSVIRFSIVTIVSSLGECIAKEICFSY